jgi:hypothetical protein
MPFAGGAVCEECPALTYQPNVGSVSCLACDCNDGNPETVDDCDVLTGECFLPTHIQPSTWSALKRLLISI